MQDLRTQLDTAATSLPDHELLVVLRSTQLALKVELQKLHSAKRGLGEEPTARKLDAELDEADGEEAASECGSHDADAPLMLQDQGELDEEEQEEEEEEPEEPAPLLVTHEEDAVRRYARTLARAQQARHRPRGARARQACQNCADSCSDDEWDEAQMDSPISRSSASACTWRSWRARRNSASRRARAG